MKELLKPNFLLEQYNKLPERFKEALDISEGQIEISGGKQFLARYGSRRMKFFDDEDGRERAISAFLTVFFDNEGLIMQIKDTKEHIAKLRDMNIWQDVTKHDGNSFNASSSASESAAGSLEVKASDDKADAVSASSDANAYGEVNVSQADAGKHLNIRGLHYPINQAQGSDSGAKHDEIGLNKTKGGTTASSVVGSGIASQTSFSNESKDRFEFLNLQYPRLRRKFGSRFEFMFYFY